MISKGIVDYVLRLKQKQEHYDSCLLEALNSIPKKYADMFLDRYIELCCEANDGQHNQLRG
jgi:hypothetical protein